tara:strand:+ start:107 stop:415 length:309 start_codon:yes stop_codon:yes gene_type:complete
MVSELVLLPGFIIKGTGGKNRYPKKLQTKSVRLVKKIKIITLGTFGGVFKKIAFENSNSNIKLNCLSKIGIIPGNTTSFMNNRSPKKHIKKFSVTCPMKKDK